MTKKITNILLCGLLTYFVLGLLLLGKGSSVSAAVIPLWSFRIFAITGFLVISIGLLILCLLGKREADKSLRRLMGNLWSWAILGFLVVGSYCLAIGVSPLLEGASLSLPASLTEGVYSLIPNACGFLFGGSLSILTVFIIIAQQKVTYSQVLLSVTVFVLVLCTSTLVFTHLPANIVPWINAILLLLFWIIGMRSARYNFCSGGNNVTDLVFSSHNSESKALDEIQGETPTTNIDTTNRDFNINKGDYELLAMLISSLLGVFLFGVASNSDGNPGPFDWGSNALFGMLTMSFVLLPIVYVLRKENLVPIFYWLVFPLIASALILLDVFPQNHLFAFIGSTGVYFFCTVVFLFSLALLVKLIQNSETSPFLLIALAETVIAIGCLCGVLIANILPDQNTRGPIVLVLATIYFIYVLLSPIILFWQNRKTVKSSLSTDFSTAVLGQTTSPALQYDEIIDDIAQSYGLSKREKEILELTGKGYNSPYIAAALVISENTTRTHLKNIYRKLNVSSRMDVVELVNKWDQSEAT